MQTIIGIKEDGSYMPGVESLTNDAARAKFGAGGIGMKVAGSFDYGVLTEQFPAQIEWGVAPYPVADENDTYLQAWQTIPPNEPRNYLFAFLARIIRHISIDRCRYQQRLCRSAYIQELSAELQACIPNPQDTEQRMETIALGQTISDFLRQQPEEARNVFVRRYWYMDSVSEIAKRFCISQSKVKSMLFRSRNALRIHLKKEGYTL